MNLELIVNSAAVATTKLKGVLLIAVLARQLGLAAFGVWTQLLVITELAADSSGLGLQNALVRFYPGTLGKHRRQLVWTSLAMILLMSLLVGATLMFFTPVVSTTLGTGQESLAVFALGGAIIPALALRLPALNLWRASNQLHHYSLASILIDSSEFLGIVTGTILSDSLYGAVLAYTVVIWAHVIILLGLTWLRVGPPSLSPQQVGVLRYSIPLVPAGLSARILARADRLVVGALLGPVQVAIYSSAYAVASVLNLIGQPFTNVLFPKVVRRPAEAAALVRRYARTYASLSVPLLVTLTLGAGLAIRVLTGTAIDTGQATLLVGAVGLGVFLFGWGGICGLSLYARDRTVTVLAITSSSALINLALNFLLIPLLGIVGAALATTGSYTYYAAVQWWALKHSGSGATPVPSPASSLDPPLRHNQ